MGKRVNIHCFSYEPSNNSSSEFLRKTGWAEANVKRLNLNSLSFDERKVKKTAEAFEEPNGMDSV